MMKCRSPAVTVNPWPVGAGAACARLGRTDRDGDRRDLGDDEQHRRDGDCPVKCPPPESVAEVPVTASPVPTRHGETLPPFWADAPAHPARATEPTVPWVRSRNQAESYEEYVNAGGVYLVNAQRACGQRTHAPVRGADAGPSQAAREADAVAAAADRLDPPRARRDRPRSCAAGCGRGRPRHGRRRRRGRRAGGARSSPATARGPAARRARAAGRTRSASPRAARCRRAPRGGRCRSRAGPRRRPEVAASGASLRRAPQERLDPGDDLDRAERLAHVVVGAEVEAAHAVLDASRDAEDEDRHGRPPAHLAQHVLAGHVRQPQLEHDERRRPAALSRSPRAPANADSTA